MKLISALAAALIALLPAAALADSVSRRLEGTWIETIQFKNTPRAVLRFKGRKLSFENMYDAPATVTYKVTEKKGDTFSISFEYRYNVKRGNGRIVERVERPEFLYHVENGRPILSEKEFEYDGRGPVLMGEYLREEDLTDGFESELKKKMNNRPFPPMMKE